MKITKTLLKKVIKDVIPDPKGPGPFSIIADVGNIEYYDQRAIEAIRSGDRKLGIQLLILAEAHESGGGSRSLESGPTIYQCDHEDGFRKGKESSVRRPDDRPYQP